MVTNGFNNKRSSVAWSVANGGINSGLEVMMFLASSGVDWVRTDDLIEEPKRLLAAPF